jgi:hypothetical protein
MLRNGLFKDALMLIAGALFSWTIASMFELRASEHASSRAHAADFAPFTANAPKGSGERWMF